LVIDFHYAPTIAVADLIVLRPRAASSAEVDNQGGVVCGG
jgi:hypothetical protein